MSGLPDPLKDSADLIEEDKRLMEELVTNVCFHLISHKESNESEGENSKGTEDKVCLKQKRESTIKELVTKFFENREMACNTSNSDKTFESIEANFTEEKVYAETEIYKANTTEVDIPTTNEISDVAPKIKTPDSDEKEMNTLQTVIEDEESLESKKCLQSVPEGETEIKFGIEDTNKNSGAVRDVNDNFILKIESSGETEKEINTFKTVTEEEEQSESETCLKCAHEGEAEIKINNEDTNGKIDVIGDVNGNLILKIESSGETEKEINHIGLTPEEEEEIKSLILLAESNYREEVSIKTEIKDDTISDCISSTKSEVNGNQNTGEYKECLKFVSNMDNVDAIYKQDREETLEGPETKISKNHTTHSSLPPMCDVRSAFYINQKMIPVKYYQELLVAQRWTPTQVLYELCCQCNWSTPEFKLIDFHKEWFWYSVKVNNLNFVSYKKARNKNGAKHLASARFLKFLGFKFSYEILQKSDRPSSSASSSWCEKYSDYNSISLSREEERRGDRYSKRSREPRTDIDNFCYRYYKRKRSSSNESRNSKILRAVSPEIRRDILKRKRRSDEKVVRLKSRRDSSPEMYHRRPLLRMDQEEKRRARLVHERIAVTHVYDCKTSHSSRSRNVRESSRHRRRHHS